MFYVVNLGVGNQDKPMIALLLLQSMLKKDFAIVKVGESTAGGQANPETCPVYLMVSWIGKPSKNLKKKSKSPWKAAMVPSAPA